MLFRSKGFSVHQFGRHSHKLLIAKHAGATVHLAGKQAPKAAFDWVIEATGSTAGLMQAVEIARPRGAVFLKSTVHGAVRLDTAPVVVNEITLIGSRCGRFEPALELLAKKKVDVTPLISAIVPLRDAPKALKLAAQPGALKLILKA